MNATSPDLRTAQWVVTTEASPWQTRDDLVLGSPTGMPDVFVSRPAVRTPTSVERVETR